MKPRWNFTGSTRRGRGHFQNGLPNQDAIAHVVLPDGQTAILAVADGHGSELHFRSDAGSKAAVAAAVRVLQRFAKRSAPDPSVLANELVGEWRAAIHRHWTAHPLTEADDKRLVAGAGWTGRDVVHRHPSLAYGSTVVAVLAMAGQVVCLQLGDGRILLVDAEGRTRSGVARDTQVRAGQTASLGQADPESSVRIAVHPRSPGRPVLILAATDGHSESYATEADFLNSGRMWLDAARTEHAAAFAARVGAFLDAAHYVGASDDITLGFLIDSEALDTEVRKSAPAVPGQSAGVGALWSTLRRRAGFPTA